ncbi:hypothetical protein MHYP_G00006370 [Metynnis hypsauchen]
MLINMYIIIFSLGQVTVLGVTVEQSELSWTKSKGKRVFISCRVTSLATDYIHWYQQKDGEALKRILYVKHDGSGLTYDPNHPQAREFSTVEQPELSWTKQNSKRAYIQCKVTGLQSNKYVHWYQQKDGEALRRILYVNEDGNSPVRSPGAEDFIVELQNVTVVGVLGQTVEQSKLFWMKKVEKRMYINCIVTGLQSNSYVHWYQQKDGEALRRILYVNKDGTSIVHNTDLPDAEDFTVQLKMLINMYIILFSLTQVAVLGVTVEQNELSWTKPTSKRVFISCKVTDLTTDYIHWYQQKDVIVVGVLGQTVEQPELSWTKQNSKRAYIQCKVTGLQSSNYVHWYQQKDGEALRRILYVNKDGTSPVRNADHPEANDFTVELQNVVVVGVLGQTVEQPELSWTKSQNKRAYINCIVTGLQNDNYVHWYQQKDGEALRRILYVNKDGSSPVRNTEVPDAEDFTVQEENGNNYVLRVKALKLSHSGVYYCATWVWVSGSHSETNCSHPLQ